jgi:micrococcal nuclease
MRERPRSTGTDRPAAVAPVSPARVPQPPSGPVVVAEFRECVRVIDGDTVELDNSETVRLIGVDTPETVHPTKPVEAFGKEAAAFLRGMVEGRRVRLEYDQKRQDRYGRTLAYLFLADGTFVNAEIVRKGYGHAYTEFPFRYIDDFRRYEVEARESRRGLWGDK